MFRVRTFESRTLSWWYGERNNIDMEPGYQRKGGLWSSREKAFLIDTILNDFDIPKLYIADFTYINTSLNQATRAYAVIDGKQRFEAIFNFFDGKIALNDDFLYSDDLELRLGGLGYRDLVQNYPNVANKFLNYNLPVMSVISDEEARIKELFVRMNLSKPLTGAELRNAMTGSVPEFTRIVANHSFFTSRVRFNMRRGQDMNAATKLLLIEFQERFVDTKKTQLDNFVQEAEYIPQSSVKKASSKVLKVLSQMTEIFLHKDPLLNSPAALVIYYWLVRNLSPSARSALRSYLVEFDQARKLNRKMARENPQAADATLLLYDTLNRSPDDQQSLERRYAVVLDGLTKFIEPGET